MAIAEVERVTTGPLEGFRASLRSLFRKRQNARGVMVALYVPPDIGAELAVPGGLGVEDLHLTLRIIADDVDDTTPRQVEQWAAEVERVARDYPVLVGNVSGVGRFNGDQAGGADVVYATLDMPGLVDLYQRVRWIGCETGVDYEREQERHDFTPHVTLAYGSVEIPDVPTVPVRIDRLVLSIGDERREYLFAGADTADRHEPMPAQPTPTAVAYREVAKAEWSAAFVNDLPDSSFAIVLPGGEKDADGRTTPRSLRKLPYKDGSGKVDAPHLRNALARLSSADLTESQAATASGRLKAAAESVLEKAADDRAEVVVAKAAETWDRDDEVEITVEAVHILRSGIEWRATTEDMSDPALVLIDDGTTVATLAETIAKSTGGIRADSGTVPVQAPTSMLERYAVIKAEGPRRYTLGVAYPASTVTKDADAHGDSMTADELEVAAWQFMVDGAKDSGLMHKNGTDGAGQVVESYIYRGPTWKVDDETVEPGDWLLGVIWSPEAWPAIESGELTGYSMQGFATRTSPS